MLNSYGRTFNVSSIGRKEILGRVSMRTIYYIITKMFKISILYLFIYLDTFLIPFLLFMVHIINMNTIILANNTGPQSDHLFNFLMDDQIT